MNTTAVQELCFEVKFYEKLKICAGIREHIKYILHLLIRCFLPRKYLKTLNELN